MTNSPEHHEHYMKMALQLAERGRFTVSPNPLVGCVIVKNDKIIGTGFHEKAGLPHAECMALDSATESIEGATAYITLEPCTHFGRTPPCTPRLINAGIKTVYVATLDPNPKVHGSGIAALKAAGMDVHVGLCEAAARQQNRIFFHVMTKQTPFVVAKWAMSIDGKTAVKNGDNRQLSSRESQRAVHQLRHSLDAILVGAHTAIQDDPLLTVRDIDDIRKQPIRIILCGKTLLPFTLRILDPDLPAATWLMVPNDIDEAWYQAALKQKLNVIKCEVDAHHHIQLPALMRYLAANHITSLLVEGGMSVLHSFFKERLVNESHIVFTPNLIGELPQKTSVAFNNIQTIGNDYYITATHEVMHV